ncbi:hypothetical protein L1049_003761 [Liquidambar formosana]|uniref:glutathione transferase n=1 Tax=Liquidambar formosana TaxID=63359 RepID=A0AAP0WZP5_LIQFO
MRNTIHACAAQWVLGVVSQAEAKLAKVLDIYEARLPKFKYLASDKYTIADMLHLPNLQSLMGTPAKKLFDSRPRVKAWCSEILARPAWAKPFGQVPVFQDEELTLFESRAIMRFISHAYQKSGKEQVFMTPKLQGIAAGWIDVEDHQFDPPASKLTAGAGVQAEERLADG